MNIISAFKPVYIIIAWLKKEVVLRGGNVLKAVSLQRHIIDRKQEV